MIIYNKVLDIKQDWRIICLVLKQRVFRAALIHGFWTDHGNEWGVALPMSEAYSDPYKVTKVERLAKLVNGY